MKFFRKFFVVLACLFVIASSCVLPAFAVDDTALSPVPELPEDVISLKYIFITYVESNDTFYLASGGTDLSYDYELYFNGDRIEIIQLAQGSTHCYKFCPLTDSYWVSISWHDIFDRGSENTGFSWSIWPGEIVYSNVDLISDNVSFFAVPSPIADTQRYIGLSTSLWQTVRGVTLKIVIVAIPIVAALIAVILVKRLGKTI